MTTIAFEDGKPVFRDGKVGKDGQGCCCKDEQVGCCEVYGVAVCREAVYVGPGNPCPEGFQYDTGANDFCVKSTFYVPGKGFTCPSYNSGTYNDWFTYGYGNYCIPNQTKAQCESQVNGFPSVNIYKNWKPAASGAQCQTVAPRPSDCLADGYWFRSASGLFPQGRLGCTLSFCDTCPPNTTQKYTNWCYLYYEGEGAPCPEGFVDQSFAFSGFTRCFQALCLDSVTLDDVAACHDENGSPIFSCPKAACVFDGRCQECESLKESTGAFFSSYVPTGYYCCEDGNPFANPLP
jgi:hypothetical protein